MGLNKNGVGFASIGEDPSSMVWNAIGVDLAIASPLFYAALIDDAA